MRRVSVALLTVCLLGAGLPASSIQASSGWQASVPFTNQVASVPFQGGGYPVPSPNALIVELQGGQRLVKVGQRVGGEGVGRCQADVVTVVALDQDRLSLRTQQKV